MTCDKAPSGWKCTRALGHDGPCAAYLDTERPPALPVPGPAYRGHWVNEESAAKLAGLAFVDRAAAIAAALDQAELRGMGCPGEGGCYVRGGTTPCREHGCRVCGAPTLEETRHWCAPLCFVHAPPDPLERAREIEIADPFACMACGSENTHQNTIHVRVRAGGREDGPGHQYSIDTSADLLQRTPLSADWIWKGRRDEVAIVLTCEQCPALTEILIWQHKGQTFQALRLVSR